MDLDTRAAGSSPRPAVSRAVATSNGAPRAAETAEETEPPEAEIVSFGRAATPGPARGGASSCCSFVDSSRRSEGQVDLWRIDAPGNPDWSAGDRVQQSARVELTGHHFTRLPAGTYRARCTDQRRGADDPEAFAVACPLTNWTIAIEAPREFHVFLDIYDETGWLVDRAVCSDWIHTFSTSPPPWVHWRSPRAGAAGVVGWAVAGSSGRQPSPIELVAGPRGIELGIFREPTQSGGQDMRLTLDGRSSVRCSIAPGKDGDGFLIAVTMPLERLADHVVLDDGRRAIDAGATVRAECRAVPRGEASDAWRSLPIQVWIELPGWKPLDFSHCLNDGPLPTVQLERAEQ
jgi:hypothetical protein